MIHRSQVFLTREKNQEIPSHKCDQAQKEIKALEIMPTVSPTKPQKRYSVRNYAILIHTCTAHTLPDLTVFSVV